jgi:hypothetical protein
MPNMYHNADSRLIHRAAGAAALTASTVLATITERVGQRTTYRTLIDLEAIKVSATNELYTLIVQLSNDSFSTNEQAAILSLGAGAVRLGGAKGNVAGDSYEIMWSTEQDGIKYRASRLNLIIGGTSPSIVLNCHSTILGNV